MSVGMVVEKILFEESSISEITGSSFKETLTQTTMSLIKGSIDDGIKSILWNKDNYQIMLFYNYPNNRMDVHFIIK